MTAVCATAPPPATSPWCARSLSTSSPETTAAEPAYAAGATRPPGTTPTCSRLSPTKLMREPCAEGEHPDQPQHAPPQVGIWFAAAAMNADTLRVHRLQFGFDGVDEHLDVGERVPRGARMRASDAASRERNHIRGTGRVGNCQTWCPPAQMTPPRSSCHCAALRQAINSRTVSKIGGRLETGDRLGLALSRRRC